MSRSYNNNANSLIADNITGFEVHLAIEFVVLSLVLTFPLLCLSCKHAMAKLIFAFVLCKNLIPRAYGKETSMTTNSIYLTIFSLI